MPSNWNEILRHAHAWCLDPKTASTRTLTADWLDAAERAHLSKLIGSSLHHQYLATRCLCRAALSHYTDVNPSAWRFRPTAHGKPKIVLPRGFRSLRFNLTHTDGLIVCLVSRAGAVGVDAEKISRNVDIDEIARHFFAPSEQADLAMLPPSRRRKRFFQIWVLKEACLKAQGRGLSISPGRIEIRFDAKGNPLPLRGCQMSLHRPTPHHVAATAIRAAKPVPVIWRNAAELFEA